MISLNVGNLFDKEFLMYVYELNKEHEHDGIQITSMFGSISGLTPTARSHDRIPTMTLPKLSKYVQTANDLELPIRYTLNQSCIGSMQDFHAYWKDSLKDTVLRLHKYGITQWTITSPLLVELVRDLLPDDYIEVSTIAEIKSYDEFTRWGHIGASGVCVSTTINRDWTALREFKQAGIGSKVSILANEACLYQCPWRRECYNLSSHDSERSDKLFRMYPFSRCQWTRRIDPVEWIKAKIVPPQCMKLYAELDITNFKISFRTAKPEIARPILATYMEQDFHGNLIDLWPPITHLADVDIPKSANLPVDYMADKYHLFTTRQCNKVRCGVDCKLCYNVMAEMLRGEGC